MCKVCVLLREISDWQVQWAGGARCVVWDVAGPTGDPPAWRKWVTEHPDKHGHWTPAEVSLNNVAGGGFPESSTFRVIVNDLIKLQLF